MNKINVKVSFSGEVEVEVPDNAKCPTQLAEKIVLSRIIATTENPDAPDSEAFEEYRQDARYRETMRDSALSWDGSKVSSVFGSWTVDKIG